MAKYDDIISLPHPTGGDRRRMSAHDRAAQFAPFAALTGFGGEIREAARRTERRMEPDEETAARINECIGALAQYLARCRDGDDLPEITVTYFCPDARKEGGEYRTVMAAVRTVEECGRTLILCSGVKIPFGNIFRIEINAMNARG